VSVAGWHEVPSERSSIYSPLGLRLVDELTGRAPLGRVTARLELRTAPATWAATSLAAVLTPSNVFVWPGLGKQRDPLSATPRRYRARIDAELYRPAYLETVDGLEFDAPPWDDDHAPVPTTRGPTDLYLLPAAAYPFPTWVRVVHGKVEDGGGDAVANVLVSQGTAEKVLTDERGAFSLPLRWAANGVLIDALDARGGRAGSHVLNLPTDLNSSVVITIL